MKKTAMGLCLLLALSGLALPQNKKGTWFLGTSFGSAGYSLSKSESGDASSPHVTKSDGGSYSLSVYPTIGYYLQDDLVLGAYLTLGYYGANTDYSNNYNSSTSSSNYKELSIAIGPFIRYYFGKDGAKGRPYLHAYVQTNLYPVYSGESTSNPGTDYTYEYPNYKSLSAGLQIGYEHYLNPTVGLQYFVGYSFSSYSYDTKYDYPTGIDPVYTYKATSHGFTFGVGLQIHLGPKN